MNIKNNMLIEDKKKLEFKQKKNAISAKWHKENPEKVKARKAKWYKANLEKAKAAQAKYRKANPDKLRASAAKWHKANSNKVKAKNAKYYKDNPEKVKAAVAKWHKANPEKLSDKRARRRTRIETGTLSRGLVAKLHKLQCGKCVCCLKKLSTLRKNYHIDHIIPLAKGGLHQDDNIQLLCVTCNLQKHAKNQNEFMREKGWLL